MFNAEIGYIKQPNEYSTSVGNYNIVNLYIVIAYLLVLFNSSFIICVIPAAVNCTFK